MDLSCLPLISFHLFSIKENLDRAKQLLLPVLQVFSIQGLAHSHWAVFIYNIVLHQPTHPPARTYLPYVFVCVVTHIWRPAVCHL